jgi:hypothetical protein
MAALALKNFCEGKGSHNLNQVVGWVHATHGEQVGICVDTEAQAIKVVEYGQIGQFGFEKVVVYARLEFRIIPFVGETDWDIDLV